MCIRDSILFIFCVIGVYPAMTEPSDGICVDCIHYNFEAGLESFSFGEETCNGLNTWTTGKYSSVDLELPNEFTQSFISPQFDLSCTNSFPFTMTGDGTIFVKVYINSADPKYTDQIIVLAEQISATDNNPIMGMVALSSMDTDFVNGWQTLNFTLLRSTTTFEGQLTFLGSKYENSTVLVDSFCYRPPNYDGDCWVEDVTITPEQESSTTVMESEPTIVTEAEPTIVTEAEPTIVTETETTIVTETETVVTEETPVTEVTPTTALPSTIVSEQTISTPTLGSNNCPIDPLIHWLQPHEYDCNLFYYCVWGEKVLRHCANGLHFNPTIQVCDWPWNAGCTTQ